MIETILIVLGLVVVAYGFIGLVGVWLVPAIGNSPLYGPGMLTGRTEPTRTYKTIMSLWNLFIGAYLVSSSSGHRTLAFVFCLLFLLCAVTSMFIRFRQSK